MRSGRGLRDEFSAFYASAYPELVAQLLAITGDAGLARAATATTLAKAWRSWPTLRQAADPLVRARWSAVMVAAEHQSTAKPRATKSTRAVVDDGGEVTEDAVLLAALRLLPPVQRRALVLHYMGGVSVNQLAALSGSSAEHVELLLDDGFTALADSLDWADEPAADPDADGATLDGAADDDTPDLDDTAATNHTAAADGDVAPEAHGPDADPDLDADPDDDLDLRFDWTAEALADTAARLPAEVTAPSPAGMLRRAALVRWSARAIPVAACAACVAAIGMVAAQAGSPADYARPAIYANNGSGAGVPAVPAEAAEPDLGGIVITPAAVAPAGPVVRLRSVALTALLDPGSGGSGSSGQGPAGSASSASGSSASGSSASGSAAAATVASGGGSTGAGSGGSSAGGSTSTGSTTPPTTPASGGGTSGGGTGGTTPGTTSSTPTTTPPVPTTTETTPATPTTTAPTTTTTEPTPVDPTTTTTPAPATTTTPTSVIETTAGTSLETTVATTTESATKTTDQTSTETGSSDTSSSSDAGSGSNS